MMATISAADMAGRGLCSKETETAAAKARRGLHARIFRENFEVSNDQTLIFDCFLHFYKRNQTSNVQTNIFSSYSIFKLSIFQTLLGYIFKLAFKQSISGCWLASWILVH